MTKKKSPPKKALAERLRDLAEELDAATGKAPKPMTEEQQIEAAIAEITRPGSLKERLTARRMAKAEETSGGGDDDGAPASPPAGPATSKPQPVAPPSPMKPRKLK